MRTEECIIKGVGAKFLYKPDISVGRMLKHENIWEAPTTSFLINDINLPTEFIFLDIGAHWGYYSVVVAHLFKGAKVIAFEPSEENLDVLCKNVAPYPNIEIRPYGISDKQGMFPYWVGELESGRGTFCESAVRDISKRDPKIKQLHFETRRLDKEDIAFADVKLAKIDVQGMEALILSEYQHLLSAADTTIIVEDSAEVSEYINARKWSEKYPLQDGNWALRHYKGF